MRYPDKFGQPCWTAEQVRKVISLTAQTSAGSAPYFLAAHSPFRRITDAKSSGRALTEEEVFQQIFSAARGQVQAFVRGEPGTGKSHLIRWLKIRADHAKAHSEGGLQNSVFVLVSRGNGSLRDALGQVVQQLGKSFERHIVPIRGAIDRLSDAAARDTLLLALALELDTHWPNRHGEPLPQAIRHLGQALRANGFGRWFKRDGGIIDRVVRRLAEGSTVEERDTFPEFTSADFEVPLTYLRSAENPGQVIVLSEDLAEEPDTREIAAKALNTALVDAIRGLTGLKGADLLEIFTAIRRQLGPDKSLAVFIEDVSVTGLDQDVVNAFEPRTGDGLCRMVAVLGVTETGWNRMAPNQRQRATHEFDVGGQVVEQWVSSGSDVAAFAARYLNAVRMTDEEIAKVAEAHFAGDVQHSHCDGCPHRTPCFASFGSVQLDGIAVGTFPFSERAPQKLLSRLSDTYYKSQRGLLDRILLPTLDQSYSLLDAGEFPQVALFSVQPPPVPAWTGFANRFCGGAEWDEHRKARLRLIAQFWTDATTAEELAQQLQPLLKPLAFPEFSAATQPVSKSVIQPRRDPLPVSGRTQPSPAKDAVLNTLLASLERWIGGAPLQQDSKFRDLLCAFLKNSIIWEDQRGTPITEKKRLVTGNKVPRIEGQTAQPGGQTYFVTFDRSRETRDLLEALLLFEYRGDRSWDFEHGELHRRNVSRWIRKHCDRAVESLQPIPPSLVGASLGIAVQVLALVTLLRRRAKLPASRVERLKVILESAWLSTEKPIGLTPELQAMVADLEQKHASIRDFIIQELGAGQGDADPKDFIDPVPILRLLDQFENNIQVQPPPTAVDQSFWKSRFRSVSQFNAYAEFPEWLRTERTALAATVTSVRHIIQQGGINDEDLRSGLTAYFEQALEIINLQRGSQNREGILPLPDDAFEQLWQKRTVQDSNRRDSWGSALTGAAHLVHQDDDLTLLAFDPSRLHELASCLDTIKKHLRLVDQHLKEEEDAGGPCGDSREQLLEVLQAFGTIAEKEQEQEPNGSDQ